MLKKKSFLLVLAIIVLMTFLFSACGSNTGSTGTTSTTGTTGTTDTTNSTDNSAVIASTSSPSTSTSSASASSTSGDSNKSENLRVGMEVGYPPMEMLDPNDGLTVVGFDVDVAKEVAKRLGYKDIEIVSTAWDGIFAALETNKYDVIISSVSIDDKRKAAYSLTKAYVANKQVLVTKAGDDTTKSPDQKGIKIGLQQGTTAENYIKDQIANGKKIDYQAYQKVTQPFADLKIGRIKAVLVDVVVAGYYVVQDKESYQIAWESPDKEPMALCFSKENADLRDKTNKVLDDMQADGTMEKISVKWFSQDITKGLE